MTTEGSDVLREPPPVVDAAWAADLLLASYDLRVAITPLRSERDRNFLATTPDAGAFVLKVSNSAEDQAVIDMENAAMTYVAGKDPGLAIPRLVVAIDGSLVTSAVAPDGRRHAVRVLTVIPGQAADTSPLPDGFAGQLGQWAARTAKALEGFSHPADRRLLEWDPRQVQTLARFAVGLREDRRQQVLSLLARCSHLTEKTREQPSGTFHGDVTMSNVLVGSNGIGGVIDFGDMHHTARICDVGISLASLLRVVAMSGTNPWKATEDFLHGYQSRIPLDPSELDVLGDVLVARLLATVLISAWRAPDNPDNVEYLTGLDAGSWSMLELLGAEPSSAVSARLQDLARSARPPARPQP